MEYEWWINYKCGDKSLIVINHAESWYNAGNPIIVNYQLGMIYTTHLWWFWGWFVIGFTTWLIMAQHQILSTVIIQYYNVIHHGALNIAWLVIYTHWSTVD